MAAAKQSKNNPTNRQVNKTKMVDSNTCENCKNQCSKGKNYIEHMKTKKIGYGVSCSK